MNAKPAHSHRILFLPGASGDPAFWHGAGQHLPSAWEKRFLAWPGLGDQAPNPHVRGFPDLVHLAYAELTASSVVIAQSMGGVVAIELALRMPSLVTHLVLTATSGGVDVTAFGAEDWRAEFLDAYPNAARWILQAKPELQARLHKLDIPTLLLWGSADRTSPPAVGRHLEQAIRGARLMVIPGGDHGLGTNQPDRVAAHVQRFLAPGSAPESPFAAHFPA